MKCIPLRGSTEGWIGLGRVQGGTICVLRFCFAEHDILDKGENPKRFPHMNQTKHSGFGQRDTADWNPTPALADV